MDIVKALSETICFLLNAKVHLEDISYCRLGFVAFHGEERFSVIS